MRVAKTFIAAKPLIAAPLLIALLALSAVPAQSQGTANPSTAQGTTTPAPAQPCRASADYRQLDFWVGDWEVKGPKGNVVGQSSVQLILADCVVFENWTGARGYTGKSFNLYNAATRKWKQVWVDDRGGMLEFTGEFREGAMRYAGESRSPAGAPLMDRLTFFPLPEGRVRQLWEQSPDQGKTWNTVFDGTYIRKKS